MACLSLGADRAGAAATKIISNTSSLNQANETPRRTVLCPRNKAFRYPYGGGMFSTSPPSPDGEGVYPHSYERLGVQHGFHVTPVLFDPSPSSTTTRQVTLQVICGPEPGKLTPPHRTAQVDPSQSKTHVITCPGRRQLIGGGFQRTDFINRGGNFATESLAVGSDTWRVSGEAFGGFGGELTGIAYCRRSRKPLLTEVTASTTIPARGFGSATTPPCVGKRRLVWTGFTTSPLGSIFYAGGPFNPDDSVTGSGYNRSSAPATLTIEGYCMKVTPHL